MTASPESGAPPSGVIRTKLLPPSPRFEEVPRPKLLARLEAGSARKLTLIGASVGYGKTTLLNQWRRTEEPDPPLGLGRLRARVEVNELRSEQLAFSEEETASLLRERLGLSIERTDIGVLLERTEGWPAGIYLASRSMRGKDAHAFVSSLRGNSRYIVDLLAEEVLAALSEEERDFMIRTSVLERMSGPLCDEVLETEGSGALLREFGHSNLLVVPLDDGGRWYRYHRLFADFLLYELKNTHPKLEPVLHGRAPGSRARVCSRRPSSTPRRRGRLRAGGATHSAPLVRLRRHRPDGDRSSVARRPSRGFRWPHRSPSWRHGSAPCGAGGKRPNGS